MIELLIATSNPGKKKEIEDYLGKFIPGIKLFDLSDMGITSSPVEDGGTFESNSVIKSVYYSLRAGNLLTIADDSGLSVEALDGEPGVNSSRFSGPECDDEKNITKLLKMMHNRSNRRAKFKTVITLSRKGKVLNSFTGEVQGLILEERRGSGGFGYDPVFFYPPLNKTFAQLELSEKNRISHRSKAIKQVKDYLVSGYL